LQNKSEDLGCPQVNGTMTSFVQPRLGPCLVMRFLQYDQDGRLTDAPAVVSDDHHVFLTQQLGDGRDIWDDRVFPHRHPFYAPLVTCYGCNTEFNLHNPRCASHFMKDATFKTWYCGACHGVFATTQLQDLDRDNLYLAAVLVDAERATFALPLQRCQYIIDQRLVNYNVWLTRAGPDPATAQEYLDALDAADSFSDGEEDLPVPAQFESRSHRDRVLDSRIVHTDLDLRFAMRCESYDLTRPVVPYLAGFEVDNEYSDYIVMSTGATLWWTH